MSLYPIPLTGRTIAAWVVVGLVLAYLLYRFRRHLFRGIPHLTADGLSLFRVVFGVVLLMALRRLRPPDEPAPGGPGGEAHLWSAWGWVEWLNVHREVRDVIIVVTFVAIAFFIVGLVTRPAYAAATAGLTICLLTAQEYYMVSHTWAPHLLVLLSVLLVPWNEGWTIDNAIRRLRGRHVRVRPPGPHYGVAVWLPGLVLGTVWAAAAFAKLEASGLDWATGGAVRYHWIEDMANAPVSWGTWIAVHDPLPVLFSVAGLAGEALFILHVFFRSWPARLMAGLVGASLLGGFWLFQGVLWIGWWLLLVVFLPYSEVAALLRRAVARIAARGARRDDAVASRAGGERRRVAVPVPAALAVTVAVILTQQAAASAARVEQIPFLTNYPMYSWTYPSPEAFNAAVAPVKFYRTQVTALDGASPRDVTSELDGMNMVAPLTALVLLRHDQPTTWQPEDIHYQLARGQHRYRLKHGEPLHDVRVEVERRIFDFDTGRLRTLGVEPPTTIDLDEVGGGESPLDVAGGEQP